MLMERVKPFEVVPIPLAINPLAINQILEDGTEMTFCYRRDFHLSQATALLTANLFYASTVLRLDV